MRTMFRAMFICGVLVSVMVASVPAFAQTTPAPPVRSDGFHLHGYLDIDGGYQATANDFSNHSTFQLYVEQGSFDAAYEARRGLVLSARAGFKIWRDLSLGLGVTRYSRTTPVTISDASLPHPFLSGRLRHISGSGGDLPREEIGLHLEVGWSVDVGDKVEIAIFGGPSYMRVTQTVVTQALFSESYPYDTATFAGVQTTAPPKENVGFNAGLDVSYMPMRHFGVGAAVRVARATVEIEPVTGQKEHITAGGAQASAGLRFRF